MVNLVNLMMPQTRADEMKKMDFTQIQKQN